MNSTAIHRGTALAPGEAIIWTGAPSLRGFAEDVFHLRALVGYFIALLALDCYQAWAKGLTPAAAIHDSVPLLIIASLALVLVGTIAWFTARSTRYVITNRRVILHYGIALPATLSLPFTQIATAAVAVKRNHAGDIALVLKPGNRMPYLKLWPLARAWHLTAPQPMVRSVPRAGLVGSLLQRALQTAERDRELLVEQADCDSGVFLQTA